MAGSRQHTIPQFLLRGFESGRRGDDTKVWVYRKGQSPTEQAIKSILFERDMYGKPLDKRITNLEYRYSRLVAEVRSMDESVRPEMHDELGELVAHLIFRTKALRDSTSLSLASLYERMYEELSRDDIAQAIVQRALRRRGKVGKLGPILHEKLPEFKEQWKKMLDETAASNLLPPQLHRKAYRLGFIDSLSRNLDSPERPASYAKLYWYRIKTSAPILLGDTVCVFDTSGKRRFKPLDDPKDEVRRLYFPIASNLLLVGSPLASIPVVDVELINQVIVSCSVESFVASYQLPSTSNLFQDLGKWSGILNPAEERSLINAMKREFLKSFGN